MDVDIQKISYFIEKSTPIYDLLFSYVSNRVSLHTTPKNAQSSVVLQHEKSNASKSSRINMLLSKVSFHCRPGTVNVIFGSGYESQRKLIEILALRQTSGTVNLNNKSHCM